MIEVSPFEAVRRQYERDLILGRVVPAAGPLQNLPGIHDRHTGIPTQVIPPDGIKTENQESDPNGKSPHVPGAKLDAGKVRPALVLGGFARALLAVSRIGTFGAVKYTENGWMEVPNGEARYDDAKLRHWLTEKTGVEFDPDSQEEHAAHEAWNALARLDLLLRRKEKVKTYR